MVDQQETTPPPVPADRLIRLQERLDHIQHAKAALETQWGAAHPDTPTPPDKEQYNFTDPESRIMVTKTQGPQQAYNGQIAMDADEGVIVAATLSTHPNDMRELVPTVDAVAQTTEGQQFDPLIVDAGYFSADNIAALDDHHIDAYMAAGADQWGHVASKKAHYPMMPRRIAISAPPTSACPGCAPAPNRWGWDITAGRSLSNHPRHLWRGSSQSAVPYGEADEESH